MSTVATKSLLLSQPKAGQGEGVPVVTLPHTTISTLNTDGGPALSVTKVEIPGVDPSTVEVEFEGANITVRCEKGHLTVPVQPGTDTSKIKADILWGVLTLSVPLPEIPAARPIKVSIMDTVKKAPAKFTEEA